MRVSVRGAGRERSVVEAALRRGGLTIVSQGPIDAVVTVAPPPLQWGEIVVDVEQRRASRCGQPLPLTRTEWAILDVLADRQVHGRADLLRQVWNYRFDPGTNLLAVHVFRLRAKIGAAAIVGEGDGYRLVPGTAGIAEALGETPQETI